MTPTPRGYNFGVKSVKLMFFFKILLLYIWPKINSTAIQSAIAVNVTNALCHSGCGTLKNPYCSMAKSAEYRSRFEALNWHLVTSPYERLKTNPSKINKVYLNPLMVYMYRYTVNASEFVSQINKGCDLHCPSSHKWFS